MGHIGGRWQAASGGVRLATECSVQSVAVRLQRDDGSWLPIEQVLGTFIHEMAHVVRDTIPKPPDRVLLIAHFSARRCPKAMRVGVSGPHGLAGSNGTKFLAPPCDPTPGVL